MRQVDHVHPTREDDVVRSLSEVVGGPAGDHVAGHRWWTPARVVLAGTTVTLTAGMLARRPCLGEAGQDRTTAHARLCWDDWGWSTLATGDESPAPGLPSLAHHLAWLVEGVARHVTLLNLSGPADSRVLLARATAAVLVAALVLLAVALLAGVDRRRPWDAAALGLAPLLALTWLTSWHVLAAVGTAVALWAWARGRPVATGVAVGLGAAAAPAAGVLLVALALVAARDRRLPDAVLAAVAAVVTWVVAAVPAWLADPAAWRAAWRLGAVDVGSTWLVGQQYLDRTPSARVVLLVSGLLWLCWAAVVALLALRARRTPSLAQVALLLVVGVLLLAPAAPPAAALVALPLAAVAVRRWRDLLVWQSCEVVHLVLTGWYVGGLLAPTAGGDASAYWFGVLVRVVGLLWLGSRVVVQLVGGAVRPESADGDPVEGGGGVADPHVDLVAHPRHRRT